MAIYMTIGYKDYDGSVYSIYALTDGWSPEDKLLYKYYRTKERVWALIKNGSNRDKLGIYISPDEINEGSPSHNREVTMLPLGIGNEEEDPLITFSDNKFFQVQKKEKRTGHIRNYSSVDQYLKEAIDARFSDHHIYLFDSDTLQWTVGCEKKPLREHIISEFDDNAPYNYHSNDEAKNAREKLINYMNLIENFIATRGMITSKSGESSDTSESIEVPKKNK